jgi:hypothetical protein
MSHLRLHEFHAILDPTKVTHNGALWWMTWHKPVPHRVKNCAAESSRSVIENRRTVIWLIIFSFRRFFAPYRQLRGPVMVTAFDFQRWVGHTRVLHTPADLGRGRMSDKAISLETSSSDRSFILSFKVLSDGGGWRSSSLSAVNTRKLLQFTSKRIRLFKRNTSVVFGTDSIRDLEAGHDFA